MARLELIQPYEMKPPGSVIELPGGIASVLIAKKIAKIAGADVLTSEPLQPEPVVQAETKASKPKATRRKAK